MPSRTMKQHILEFISEYSSKNSVAPSYREISAGVGLKSLSSVSRYIEELKGEGKLVPINQKGRAIALTRRIEFFEVLNQPQRVCLEIADGGAVFFDCYLEKSGSDAVSVSFSGILDASQMKRRVGQVVSCRIDND